MMEKITVSWFDENKTAVLCTYNGEGWTLEDFYDALEQQRALIESVDRPKVHVLVDVRRTGWIPKGASLLPAMRKMSSGRHPRQGQTIIVGAHGTVAEIAKTASKLMWPTRQELRFATTLEEAMVILNYWETTHS